MKKLLILLFLLCLLPTAGYAIELPEEFLQESGVDALQESIPEEAKDVLTDYRFLEQIDVSDLFHRLGEKATESLRTHFASAAQSAVVVLVIVTLCSLASAFFPDGKAPGYVTVAGVLAIAMSVIVESGSFIRSGTETIQTLKDFSTLLLPCLAGVAASGGAIMSASAKYAAAMLFMNVLLTVCVQAIAPLINVYLACIVARSAFESNAFSAMADLVKWGCMTLLTLIVVVFTAYLSISGLITSSGDMVTTRFAKAAISTALPVVGKMVSDAASTVVAGVGVLRNSIGVFGMVVVVCVTLAPFLSMGMRYLMFKAASSAAAIFPDQRFSKLIDGIGTAFGMMMAMTGTGAFMLFISLISLIRAVSG